MKEIGKTIELLMQEFDALLVKRDSLKNSLAETERKISGLQQSLQGLTAYAKAQDDPMPLEFSKIVAEIAKRVEGFNLKAVQANTHALIECCREALRRNGGWMSAQDVRVALHADGFDFSGYTSNPLASIHTTLKRVKSAGSADSVDREGTTYYKWKIQREESAPTPVRGGRR